MKSECIRASVRSMQAYVPGEQPAVPDLIKLNTNENPYPPAPGVQAELDAFAVDGLRRYPPPGSPALREAAARLHGCSPEQVFFGNGSDEILALCTRAFLEQDEAVGFFAPSYSLYPVLAAIRDVATLPVALGADFAWALPPQQERLKLFFLTNPNAPTGMMFPKEEIRRFCASFAGIVVIDEAYVDFATWDCMDLALEHPNVLVTRSLSKSYSLAGLRVGYVVGAPEWIAALDTIKDSYNLDMLAQKLALAALKDQAHMHENTGRILATRKMLSDELAGRGFQVYPSETNFVWCRPPVALSASAYVQGLRERSILIRHFAASGLDAYVRITVGTDQDIRALLEATDELLEGEGA